MSFSNQQITDIDLNVKFLPEVKSKVAERSEFFELLTSSPIGSLFDVEADSTIILTLPKFMKGLVEGSIVRFSTKNWYFSIGQEVVSLSLTSKLTESLKEARKYKITKKILDEGTEILGKVMLWVAGASKKTEIEIEVDVEFTVDSRAENLNHMIDKKRLESADKIGCTISQQTGRYHFTAVDDEKEIEFNVVAYFPRIDDTWNRRTDRVGYQVKFIRTTNLEDIDMNREVARIRKLAKIASVIIGA